MILCDKCGKSRNVRRVALKVDAGVDWRSKIELELCDDCAAKFYAEADKFIEEMRKKFSDFKASMRLMEPQEDEEEEVSPELRRRWHEHCKKAAEWILESMKRARIKMVLVARKERQCAFCGQPAFKPVRCPKCGAWVCSEHLGAHMKSHYVKLVI